MMGQLPPEQNSLFYDFCLEKFVPQDHQLRKIDALLDFSHLRQYLKEYYSHLGRPSVDPELMIRMLLIGYCYGIRSERQLCEDVHVNLAYRWFCKLGLEDKVPHHSTFSTNRHGRFKESDLFRHLFEDVVELAINNNLVSADGFAVDASLIKADTCYENCITKEELKQVDHNELPKIVQQFLETLDIEAGLAFPKKISLSDPESRWAANREGAAYFSYSANYLVDTQTNIIVDAQATPTTRRHEVESTISMLQRVYDRFNIKPRKLMGDTAYGVAYMLGWLIKYGIEPHMPVWDKTDRTDGTFSLNDFKWDEQTNEYRCPANKSLLPRRRNFKNKGITVTKADTIIYRSAEKDCKGCHLKSQCIPNTSFRKIARSIHEDARDIARHIMQTDEYQQSRHERKKVEMMFAHLKRILKLDRLRLRGLNGAQDEFLLAATAQNLRRMAKVLSQPPPDQGINVPV
jgi:transposase